MKTVKLNYPHSFQIEELSPTVAAIGFFDGIHLGHQKVIQTAISEAKQRDMESAVITFHPHPSVILNNSQDNVKYITPLSVKERLLKQMGINKLYIINFNKELSLLSPQEFINHFIIGLHINYLIAGFDFTFGHKGKGNMNNISTYVTDDFSYSVIPRVEYSNEKVSSTSIRKFLKSGNIGYVNKLLGREFNLSGMVGVGDKRGREIGYRTANLIVENDVLLPKSGVYAVKVIYNHHTYEGMANIGVRPTFHKDETIPSIEIHIFNFNENIYGAQLDVQLIKFIREEQKFNQVEDLIHQLERDEKNIKTLFKGIH